MLQFGLKTSRGARAWLVFLVVLSLVTIVSGGGQSTEAATIATQNLFGPWQITLTGVTGCGVSTLLVNLTLDTTGKDTNATIVTHSAGCGDGPLPGQTFQIISLNPNGSGMAGLSCGPGCGFTFAIQVAPDATIFNLVDITDPGNFLEGVAIHQ